MAVMLGASKTGEAQQSIFIFIGTFRVVTWPAAVLQARVFSPGGIVIP